MQKRRRDTRPAQHFFFKCPNCKSVQKYSAVESQRLFILCKRCSKEFRAAECSPLTGGEAGIVDEETVKTQPTIVANVPPGAPERTTPRPRFSRDGKESTPDSRSGKRPSPRKKAAVEEEMSPGPKESRSEQGEPPKRGIFRRIFKF